MTTLQMETGLSGTSEEPETANAPAVEGAPVDMPPEVQAKLAELRQGAAPTEAESFAARLADSGVGVTVKPPREPEERAQAPAEAPESAPDEGTGRLSEDDGLDALIEAASGRPLRDQRLETSQQILEAAQAKDLPPGLAKALAHSVPRKEAREFLEAYGSNVQLGAAGQPAPQSPAAELDTDALAEVPGDALGGEETASATTERESVLAQRLERVERMLQAQEDASLRNDARAVVGELAGEFPGLVRDGKTHPDVAQAAAALMAAPNSPYAGDFGKAIRAVAPGILGVSAPATRQQLSDPAHSPDLEAPSSVLDDVATGPIELRQEQDILSAVMTQHRNSPREVRQAALAKAKQTIDRRNKAYAARTRR